MRIAIGADHAGYRLKDVVVPLIESLGHTVEDFGCSIRYRKSQLYVKK